MLMNLSSLHAASGSAIGRLLRQLGLPDWALWVFLGIWISIWFVRRYMMNS